VSAVEVYVLRTPLEGLEVVGGVLGDAYPGAAWHYAVLLRSEGECVVLDFLPDDPLSPVTAMRYVPPVHSREASYTTRYV
jgi:hypothetical protein